MSVLSFPSWGHPDEVDGVTRARLDLGRTLGVAGIVAYNWWVVVPFVPGLMPSANGFFSDLEATGGRDATWMQHCDVAAGVLLVTAFLIRGASGRHGYRPEWKWMLAFGAAGGIGGAFPYACAEGLSATCRRLEWHLQLPFHHYVHVVSGIAEFVFLTTAVVVAERRTRGESTRESHSYQWLFRALLAAYPLLALAYLTDRLGTLIEPVFFVIFSTMVIVQLFEPIGEPSDPDHAEDRRHLRSPVARLAHLTLPGGGRHPGD